MSRVIDDPTFDLGGSDFGDVPDFSNGDTIGPDTGPVDMGLPPIIVDVTGSGPDVLPGLPPDLPPIESPSPPGRLLPSPGGRAGAQPVRPKPIVGGPMPGFLPGPGDPNLPDFPSLPALPIFPFLDGGGSNVQDPSGTLHVNVTARAPRGGRCHPHRAGTPAQFGGTCPPGTSLTRKGICRKRPSMNVLNSCALSRATRRVSGFLNRVKHTQKHLQKALSHAMPVHHRRAGGYSRGGCQSCGARTRSACLC